MGGGKDSLRRASGLYSVKHTESNKRFLSINRFVKFIGNRNRLLTFKQIQFIMNSMVKEMSIKDMQSVNGGLWKIPALFVLDLVMEYIYDPDQAMADFNKGRESIIGK